MKGSHPLLHGKLKVTSKQPVVVRQRSLLDLDSPLHGKVRGERSVMDFPFFALSKVAVHKPMEWQLGDVTIAIRPSATGMATMYDKEIILYIASLMAQDIADGSKIYDTFTFTAHDFFRITGVPRPSKRDYQRFSEALERLQGTQVRTNIQTGSKIDRGWFSWLSEAQAQYHQLPNGDEVLRTVSVRLCGWLHRAISRDGHIYHYHHDYFRLGTIERRLYEIAHCHCEGESVEMPLDLLSTKVGSTASLHRFKHHLKEVEAEDRLPEYSISLKNVVPDQPRIDSRGRRISKPDTVVVLTPKGKSRNESVRIDNE
ncbi:replication initiator protein A [Sphingomonas sp. BAUL-RG-20F-R05-02]|uniref:replication initiator protein A n=1 Tax=Sphingomonas sp. BAUL-RG-20F-R05-02 TaxID=2914830 RepID=UPI002412D203|nr:replication initiator protein A [Sphingomonas sp. BAUL-RG-20F-R05-02]